MFLDATLPHLLILCVGESMKQEVTKTRAACRLHKRRKHPRSKICRVLCTCWALKIVITSGKKCLGAPGERYELLIQQGASEGEVMQGVMNQDTVCCKLLA